MRCIFCKSDSVSSCSVEHIIPESMGNTNHILPKGAVCDACNQYFAIKVERPLLESSLFRHLRSGMEIPNKRGRIPNWDTSEEIKKPTYRLMGRFLSKVGLEVLAFKTLRVKDWNTELVEKIELDELRNYARFNAGNDWPFTTRTLHPVNATFKDGEQRYHLLHEFDILITQKSEAYLVLSLFGVELAINLGGRSLDGFRNWLQENQFASPLYLPKQTS